MSRYPEFRIFRYKHWYSTESLTRRVETALSELHMEGWDIISVSYSFDGWYRPTAFVSVRRA